MRVSRSRHSASRVSFYQGFTATRFGPSSKGQTYGGYLIIRKITPRAVDAYLHINVTASTPTGSYTQKEEYHGDFTFVKGSGEAVGP